MEKHIVEDDLLILFLDDTDGWNDDIFNIPDDLVKRYENARNNLDTCLEEIQKIMDSKI
jgi:hypothetical protein